MSRPANPVPQLRASLAELLRSRVAGAEGAGREQRILAAPGPRWFGEDRPIRTVHGDASMFIGGLRALLLQSLHPRAMAAVAGHSDFRTDPWGRLQRTAYFLAVTTFGPGEDAQAAVERVRSVHVHVRGTTRDGEPYAANDPHLLRWVHVAEADSFLAAHQRYGANKLDAAGCDGYVADIARVGAALGVPSPPRSRRELDAAIRGFRGELRGTPESREASRFLLLSPPLPIPVRPAYGLIAAAAVSLLPWWARRRLLLPYLPLTEAVAIRPAGELVTRTLRWAMTAEPKASVTTG